MKTAQIFLQADNSSDEETPIKTGAGKLLKSVLIIFMLILITLMSSCFVRAPEHERHGDRHHDYEHHDNEHHD
jgi:hypothetical protein